MWRIEDSRNSLVCCHLRGGVSMCQVGGCLDGLITKQTDSRLTLKQWGEKQEKEVTAVKHVSRPCYRNGRGGVLWLQKMWWFLIKGKCWFHLQESVYSICRKVLVPPAGKCSTCRKVFVPCAGKCWFHVQKVFAPSAGNCWFHLQEIVSSIYRKMLVPSVRNCLFHLQESWFLLQQ